MDMGVGMQWWGWCLLAVALHGVCGDGDDGRAVVQPASLPDLLRRLRTSTAAIHGARARARAPVGEQAGHRFRRLDGCWCAVLAMPRWWWWCRIGGSEAYLPAVHDGHVAVLRRAAAEAHGVSAGDFDKAPRSLSSPLQRLGAREVCALVPAACLVP